MSHAAAGNTAEDGTQSGAPYPAAEACAVAVPAGRFAEPERPDANRASAAAVRADGDSGHNRDDAGAVKPGTWAATTDAGAHTGDGAGLAAAFGAAGVGRLTAARAGCFIGAGNVGFNGAAAPVKEPGDGSGGVDA